MAHFPRHEYPRWELFRDESHDLKSRREELKKMHTRINRSRASDSGLWWSEQRFVDQVVPSECVNPDHFDTLKYRYQVFARPPPIMCNPRTLAEISDQTFPVRYNVKRIALDKPLGNAAPGCHHHWSRYPWKTTQSVGTPPINEDCSKNNNIRSIRQGSSIGKIDTINTLRPPFRETPVRPVGANVKPYTNECILRSPAPQNCIRNNWIVDSRQAAKNITANKNKINDHLLARSASPCNQMCPRVDEQLDQPTAADSKKDDARFAVKPSKSYVITGKSASSCSINSSIVTRNNNKRPTPSNLSLNSKVGSPSPGHESVSGTSPQAPSVRLVKKDVSSAKDAVSDVLWGVAGTESKGSIKYANNQNCNNNSNNVVDHASRPEGAPSYCDYLLLDSGDHQMEIRPPVSAVENNSHCYSINSPRDNTCYCKNNNANTDEIDVDMSGKHCHEPYLQQPASTCTPHNYYLRAPAFPCSPNEPYLRAPAPIPNESSQRPVSTPYEPYQRPVSTPCESYQRPVSTPYEPYQRPPAPTPRRSHCGRLVFSTTAECPRLKPRDATAKSRMGPTDAYPREMMQSLSRAMPVTKDKANCHGPQARDAYVDKAAQSKSDILTRPETHAIGYNTYKIIASKQYHPPQEDYVLSKMKLPPHLAEYREFTRRCPNFRIGRYDRLDPANEMKLPSHKSTTTIKASLSPFIYTKNSNYDKYPPLFYQPVNTDTLGWHLPAFQMAKNEQEA